MAAARQQPCGHPHARDDTGILRLHKESPRLAKQLALVQYKLGLSYAEASVVRLLLTVAYSVHFLSCLWIYVGYNWSPDEHSLSTETTWIAQNGYEQYSAFRLYCVGLYVATLALFGGLGSIYPANFAEQMVMICMLLIASSVWTWVLGSVAALKATESHDTQYKR